MPLFPIDRPSIDVKKRDTRLKAARRNCRFFDGPCFPRLPKWGLSFGSFWAVDLGRRWSIYFYECIIHRSVLIPKLISNFRGFYFDIDNGSILFSDYWGWFLVLIVKWFWWKLLEVFKWCILCCSQPFSALWPRTWTQRMATVEGWVSERMKFHIDGV